MDGTPAVRHGTYRAIYTVKRVIDPRENTRLRQHFWRNGNFSEIVPRLRVNKRCASYAKTRVFEYTAA
ncbi:hypothetical protein MGSAQ_000194 [marine sediment metagenome]|uniref:Uncharacterized protein n=1 Tax=marine sediment metagenome TaxID=412755 RepID=A0A1B6NY18_9ZZZZ